MGTHSAPGGQQNVPVDNNGERMQARENTVGETN